MKPVCILLGLGIFLPTVGQQPAPAPAAAAAISLPEGPRALDPRGLENLEAFTRALSYVRFFHPSNEAAKADWNRLAVEGVRAVETAASSPELAQRLQVFFAPYAPSAQFLTADQAWTAPAAPAGATFAVRWKYQGFGQNEPNTPYRSTREYLPLADNRAKPWPDPLAEAPIALPGGVRLWLPSVVLADTAKATLPKGPADPFKKSLWKASGTGTAANRATRLGDVALAWGIFQHFYPYFDVVKVDWPQELTRALRSAALDPDAAAFTRTLQRLVAALQDGHGYVYGPEFHAPQIPSLLLTLVDGAPVVRSVGPSAKAVPLGSRILEVDGEAAAEHATRLRTQISAATEGWRATRLAQEFLDGAPGKPVRLRYQTPSGAVAEATLPRDASGDQLPGHGKPAKQVQLRPGIWYVNMARMSEDDFYRILPSLAAAKGVIFDLRGYPSMGPVFLQHLSNQPLKSARWNVPVITQPDGKDWEWNTTGWDLAPKKPTLTGKLAFLTGGGAISYAESCMGIVEAYHLAEIVGEATAGTNGNVNPFTLPGDFRVSWTGMKVLKQDGSRHHGIGIQPTVPVRPTLRGLAEGRDEVLEKGLEVVSR